MMGINRKRLAAAGVLTLVAALLTGCRGWATVPDGITQTTATLHAQTECVADTTDNPCTGWFQYWADGSTAVLTTEHVTVNINTNGLIDFKQTVTGLTPDTLYHYQFCGYGDRNIAQPGMCLGPLGGGAATRPGERPDPANFNATQKFRTASATTVGTVDIGRVLSTAETAERPLKRDVGSSIAYSETEALWVFGDTIHGSTFLALGSAAKGPYRRGVAPTQLNELPRPPAPPQSGLTSPANFFPAVQGLMAPNDPPVPCGSTGSNSYAAAWGGSGARIPGTNRVMLVWADMCIADTGWIAGRWRIGEYDPATNRFLRVISPFVSNPIHVDLPHTMKVASPVFGNDGFVYLFGSRRNPHSIFVARVSADPAAWGNAANYRWWDGQVWNPNHETAATVLTGVDPWGISVHDFSEVGGGKKLAMMVKDSFYDSPHFRIYTADSPLGPWTAGPSGRVPDHCRGGGFGCYAMGGHPELSTSTSFVFTWFNPTEARIRLGTVAW